MLIIENQDYFDKVITFAEMAGLRKQLQEQLDYLKTYACSEDEPTKTICFLSPDSPASFNFAMYVRREEYKGIPFDENVLRNDLAFRDRAFELWFYGGLLYHGPVDGFGSGSGPTFAVTLTPTNGWSVHT